MATTVDISHSAGETLSDFAWVFYEPMPNPLDVPTTFTDTTGWSAHLMVRTGPGSATLILDLRSDTGGLVIADGTISPVLSFDDSVLLPPGTYYYELLVGYSDGASKVVARAGTWTIKKATVTS